MLELRNAAKDVAELFSSEGGFETRRARDWLSNRIDRASREQFAEIVTITPALAEMLLKRNAENRNFRQVVADKYAHDISEGNWALNGESIKVSDEGTLDDGQHRLAAVVSSGCSIKSYVAFGLPRAARATMDQGKPRSTGDYLKMGGHCSKNVASIAALSSLIWQMKVHGRLAINSANRPTKLQTTTFYSENKASIDRCFDATPSTGVMKVGGRTFLALVNWLIWDRNQRNAKSADYFIERLVRGDGLTARDPIYAARERLLNAASRMTQTEKLELLVRAWNAHRQCRQVKNFPIKNNIPPIAG